MSFYFSNLILQFAGIKKTVIINALLSLAPCACKTAIFLQNNDIFLYGETLYIKGDKN